MSGVAGYLGCTASAGRALISRCEAAQRHRGPAHGTAVGDLVAVVQHADRESSAAPATDGRYALVLDGFLDNATELRADLALAGRLPADPGRHSELALAAWRTWGKAGLGRCAGCFAMIIADLHAGTLTLVRDELGGKPLYLAALPDPAGDRAAVPDGARAASAAADAAGAAGARAGDAADVAGARAGDAAGAAGARAGDAADVAGARAGDAADAAGARAGDAAGSDDPGRPGDAVVAPPGGGATVVLVASEIPALVRAGGLTVAADEESVYDFLCHGVRPGQVRTCYAGVSRVLPGEMVTVAPDGTLTRRHYGHLRADLAELDRHTRPANAVDQAHMAVQLGRAVHRRAADGDDVGVPAALADLAQGRQVVPAPELVDPARLVPDLAEAVPALVEPLPGPATYAYYQAVRSAGGRVGVLLDLTGARALAADGAELPVRCRDLWHRRRIGRIMRELAGHPLGTGRWLWTSGRVLADRLGRRADPVWELLDPALVSRFGPDGAPRHAGKRRAARQGGGIQGTGRHSAEPSGTGRGTGRRGAETQDARVREPSTGAAEYLTGGPERRVGKRSGRLRERVLDALPPTLEFVDRAAARACLTLRPPLLDADLLRTLWALDPTPSALPPVSGTRESTMRAWVDQLDGLLTEVFLADSFGARGYFDQLAVLRAYHAYRSGAAPGDPALFWRLASVELWLRGCVDPGTAHGSGKRLPAVLPAGEVGPGWHPPAPARSDYSANPGRQLFTPDGRWARYPLRAERIEAGTDLLVLVARRCAEFFAGLPEADQSRLDGHRWYLFVSATAAAVAQRRTVPIWEIWPGRRARLASRLARTVAGAAGGGPGAAGGYPLGGLGALCDPTVAQLAIETYGLRRVLAACVTAAVGRVLDRPDWWARAAGPGTEAVGGPRPEAAYPANISVRLGPRRPVELAEQLSSVLRLSLPEPLAGRFGGTVLLASDDNRQLVLGHDTDADPVRLATAAAGNPLGQAREQTPFAVVVDLSPVRERPALDADPRLTGDRRSAVPATGRATPPRSGTPAAPPPTVRQEVPPMTRPPTAPPAVPVTPEPAAAPSTVDRTAPPVAVRHVDAAVRDDAGERAEPVPQPPPAQIGFGGFRWEYEQPARVRPPWRRRGRNRARG